jgi:hypothetical protein
MSAEQLQNTTGLNPPPLPNLLLQPDDVHAGVFSADELPSTSNFTTPYVLKLVPDVGGGGLRNMNLAPSLHEECRETERGAMLQNHV